MPGKSLSVFVKMRGNHCSWGWRWGNRRCRRPPGTPHAGSRRQGQPSEPFRAHRDLCPRQRPQDTQVRILERGALSKGRGDAWREAAGQCWPHAPGDHRMGHCQPQCQEEARPGFTPSRRCSFSEVLGLPLQAAPALQWGWWEPRARPTPVLSLGPPSPPFPHLCPILPAPPQVEAGATATTEAQEQNLSFR